jgi:hypothetical protein
MSAELTDAVRRTAALELTLRKLSDVGKKRRDRKPLEIRQIEVLHLKSSLRNA